jgi:hypothetical protein
MSKSISHHLPVCLLLTVMCINEYNPFNDPYNAGAVITDRPFTGSPTAEIFSTDTIVVGVSVPKLVTSFRLQIDHNRYWTDTTVRGPASARYRFAVSFTDTGFQRIRLFSTLSNGVTIQNEDTFRVSSPLHQNDITLSVGDMLNLATRPVQDDSVWYHWKIGLREIKIRVPEGDLMYPVNGVYAGTLWVSAEYQGIVSTSPASTFRVSLKDTSPPLISFFAGIMRGDTILTGDKTYFFNAQITDTSGIDTAKIGGISLENLFPSQYFRTFRNLDLDTLNQYTLRAIDNSGLERDTTFHLRYIASLAGGQATRLRIINVNDTVRTSKPSYIIFGMVTETNLPKVNITATAQGGTIGFDTTVSIGNFVAEWHLTVGLENNYNTIIVVARDTLGTFLTNAKLTIFRSMSVIDRVAPFVSVKINGSLAMPNKKYFIPGTGAELSLQANDASGIAFVRVNDSAMTPVAPGFSWRRTMSPISHMDSTTFTIEVGDNAGNTTAAAYIAQKNLTPALRDGYTFPAFAGVGRKLEFPLDIIDDDQVSVNLRPVPGGMQAIDRGGFNNWFIEWTPGLADTGMRSVDITLADGFDAKSVTTWKFPVIGANGNAVRFEDRSVGFPRYTVTGAPVGATLRIKPGTGQPPYRYQAVDVDRRRVVMDTAIYSSEACAFLWIPWPADTGAWCLALTVTDVLGGSDTLSVNSFEIMPPNTDPCSLSVKFSATADTLGGILDMRNRALPDTVVITINDSDRPEVDHRTVFVDAPGRIRFGGDSSIVYIVLEPWIHPQRDTILVAVADQEGAYDMVIIPVLFPAGPAPFTIDSADVWLDAGNGINPDQNDGVTDWTDGSANGFTVTSAGIPPHLDTGVINGRPAILFNGAGRLLGAIPNWDGKPFTVIFVAQLDALNLADRYALVSPSIPEPELGIGIPVGGELGMFLNHRNVDKNILSGLKITPKTWYIISFVSGGLNNSTMNLNAFRNGTKGVPMTITDPLLASSSAFVLGAAQSTANNFPWNGYIAEVVFFNDSLPDIKRALIEKSLSVKYGIPLEK